MYQLLAEQNMWTIITLGVTIFFGILPMITSIRSRFRIEPRLYYENRIEISKLSNRNRKIIVRYDNKIVNQVTTTQIWFWNSGKKPIKKEDIPERDPIRIGIIEGNKTSSILDFNISETSRDSINAIAAIDKDQQIVLSFDFLDCNDFIGLEVQHDGSVKAIPQNMGIILGPKKRLRVENDNYMGWPRVMRIIWGFIKGIFGVFVAAQVIRFSPVLQTFFIKAKAIQFLKDDIPKDKLELAANKLMSYQNWAIIVFIIILLIICSYFNGVYKTLRGPYFRLNYSLVKDIKKLIGSIIRRQDRDA